MTGAMQGADVGQLRATAKLFDSQASEIDQYRVSVSKGVEASAWIGPFAVKWRAMWQAEDSRYLQETVDMLRDIVKQLHTQADQQERASSAGADTSLGSVGLGLAGLAALKAAEDRDQGAAGSTSASKVAKAAEKWAKGAVGRGIDYDHAYGFQCVDVANDYASTLFPKTPMEKLLGWQDKAAQIFPNASTEHFDRVPHTSSGPNALPRAGDIICFDATPDNSYGHIAVVEKVEGTSITIIEQDGFNPGAPAARRVITDLSRTSVQGYLRPKL